MVLRQCRTLFKPIFFTDLTLTFTLAGYLNSSEDDNLSSVTKLLNQAVVGVWRLDQSDPSQVNTYTKQINHENITIALHTFQ